MLFIATHEGSSRKKEKHRFVYIQNSFIHSKAAEMKKKLLNRFQSCS